MSAYDYFNFVMNSNGRLKTWGDADFARKLVEFAKIEVIAQPRRRSPASSPQLRRSTSGPAPYNYWGAAEPGGLLART